MHVYRLLQDTWLDAAPRLDETVKKGGALPSWWASN